MDLQFGAKRKVQDHLLEVSGLHACLWHDLLNLNADVYIPWNLTGEAN